MRSVGVKDRAVVSDQPLVDRRDCGRVLPFMGAASEGIEGFGFFCGIGRGLVGLVVALGAARPVLQAELALLGLLHLRDEGRLGRLQAQGPHRRMAQHPGGTDGENLLNLGKTRVPARVHAALCNKCG